MSRPRNERQDDLFRLSLEAIIDPGHLLVRLDGEVDLAFLGVASAPCVPPHRGSRRFPPVCWECF